MKAILAVVAVLLAVTHVGDTHGDHTRPHPPFREALVVVCVFVSFIFYLHLIILCYYDVCVCVFCNETARHLGRIAT